MFVTILTSVAAMATIAGFLLEVWQVWKKYKTDKPRADGTGKRKR